MPTFNPNTESMEPITLDESRKLNALESVIQKGQHAFFAVGLALSIIRLERLYRSEFPSFEAYCSQKWNWTKRYVNYVIQAAQVVALLPEEVGTIVPNEAAARELARVPEPSRVEVLAAAGDQPTARSIKEAAAAVLAPIVMQATAAPDAKDAPADKPKRKYTKRNLPAAATAGSASARSAVTPPAADSSFPAAHVASKPSEQSAGEAGNGSPAKLVSDEMAARQMADKNFFAIQFEEIASAVVDDGTDEQLEAAVKSAKKAVKDLQAEQKQRRKF